MLSLVGWWLVLVVALLLPWFLAHFDYWHPSIFSGLLVLTIYLVVVMAIVIPLLRSGRRLRGK